MSKKNFTGGLNSLLGDQPKKPKRGRSATSTREITKSSQEGTKENETRATFIVNEELLEKLKSGPLRHYISGTDIKWQEFTGEFKNFDINFLQ